jgi:hypothetical protein
MKERFVICHDRASHQDARQLGKLRITGAQLKTKSRHDGSANQSRRHKLGERSRFLAGWTAQQSTAHRAVNTNTLSMTWAQLWLCEFLAG